MSWWLSGSSWCHGAVCSLWLWYFLIILTYYFWISCLLHTSGTFEKIPLNFDQKLIWVWRYVEPSPLSCLSFYNKILHIRDCYLQRGVIAVLQTALLSKWGLLSWNLLSERLILSFRTSSLSYRKKIHSTLGHLLCICIMCIAHWQAQNRGCVIEITPI